MPTDEKTFEGTAGNTLLDLMEQIDDALGDVMDVDLAGGVLNIELDGGACYVINKQAPNREIWMSSPSSGARHFRFDDAKKAWTDTRGGEDLYTLLSSEMAAAAGRPFRLSRDAD